MKMEAVNANPCYCKFVKKLNVKKRCNKLIEFLAQKKSTEISDRDFFVYIIKVYTEYTVQYMYVS